MSNYNLISWFVLCKEFSTQLQLMRSRTVHCGRTFSFPQLSRNNLQESSVEKLSVAITDGVHTCDKNIACPVASSQKIPPRVSLFNSEAAVEGCSVCMSRHFLQL